VDTRPSQLIEKMVPAEGIEPRPVVENTEVADSTKRQKPKTIKSTKTPTTGTYLEHIFFDRVGRARSVLILFWFRLRYTHTHPFTQSRRLCGAGEIF
jgi:hypothetical protein